jgi:hypothetical protein
MNFSDITNDHTLALIYGVDQGHVDALKAYIDLYKAKALIDNAMQQIKDQALAEAYRYEKTFELEGVKVTQKADAGKWNYDHVTLWWNTKQLLERIQEASKAAHRTGHNVTTEDGEQIEPAMYTPGKDNFSITIK